MKLEVVMESPTFYQRKQILGAIKLGKKSGETDPMHGQGAP